MVMSGAPGYYLCRFGAGVEIQSIHPQVFSMTSTTETGYNEQAAVAVGKPTIGEKT
jgi:hypothetical protein